MSLDFLAAAWECREACEKAAIEIERKSGEQVSWKQVLDRVGSTPIMEQRAKIHPGLIDSPDYSSKVEELALFVTSQYLNK